MRLTPFAALAALALVAACGSPAPAPAPDPEPEPARFPRLTTPSPPTTPTTAGAPPSAGPDRALGAVVEIFTKEASDGQITLETTAAELATVDFGLIHALTGPIAVEGAEPGDLLAVTIHEAEVQGPGWSGIFPGFGFLADEFTEPWLRSFDLEPGATEARFNDRITLPLAPFPGVLGVAPATDEMLVTIPPRENGGNMDNRHMRPGATVYIPVQVPGANFSIGDTHAVQGDGRSPGAPSRPPCASWSRWRSCRTRGGITEPEYETDDYYAVTGFDPDIDEAAKKATRHMIAWLVAEHGLTREEAYVLCSLAETSRSPRPWTSQHAGEHAHAEVDLLRGPPPMKFPAAAILTGAALTALSVHPASARNMSTPIPSRAAILPRGCQQRRPDVHGELLPAPRHRIAHLPGLVTRRRVHRLRLPRPHLGRARRGRHRPPGHERPRLPLPAELVPDGGQIAYAADIDRNFDIFVTDLATGESRRLTTHPFLDLRPRWSADGSRVLFTTERDGTFDLWVHDLEAGTAEAVIADRRPTTWPETGSATPATSCSFPGGARQRSVRVPSGGIAPRPER